jgi:hypothetical protein
MPKAEASKSNYEEKAGEVTKYDKLLKEATIGYFKAKIWGDDQIPGAWGEVNDRVVKNARKGNMAVSFKQNGIQRCRVDTAIKMAMNRSWFDGNGVASVEGISIDEVPELQLTEEGKEAGVQGKLKPLEGLGRRGGIEVVYGEMDSALKTMEARIKKINAGKTMTDKLKEEKIELELQIQEVQGQLSICPYWTFRIINPGECRMKKGELR